MRPLTRRWALATRASAAAAAAAAVAAAALLAAAPTRIAAAVAPAPSPADDGFAAGGAFVADLPLPVAACGTCAFYVDERSDGSMGLRREDASEAGALAKQQVGPAASDKKKNKKDNKKDDLPCGGGCNNLKLDWLGIEILGDALAGVPVKKKLSLKGNALTRLDAQELRGLSELKVLELDKNELQGPQPVGALAELESLEVLTVEKNDGRFCFEDDIPEAVTTGSKDNKKKARVAYGCYTSCYA